MARAEQAVTAKQFVDFANKTGSPYHTVQACKATLQQSGFEELHDGKSWSLKSGGKYFVTKGDCDVMAFVVGGKFTDGSNSGFSMVGAHTDSPCLRLRPNSKMSSSGMLQMGVQTYGGGLWHTWFDRPLGLAGKVVFRAETGNLKEHLVRIDKPIMIIPNLAIHLLTADERKAFNVNTESHLQPVMCSKVYDDEAAASSERGEEPKDGVHARHHYILLQFLAKEIGCKPGDIVDADLCLMDAQPSNIIGAYDEFISSPRIDNLISTWAATQGLCNFTSSKEKIDASQDICLMCSFDHEEVGSQSATGADGDTLPTWLRRILSGLGVQDKSFPEVFSRSFLVSADAAHGVHPNYASKHQSEHRPELHKGVVIKSNANQRYATTPLTAALFREVCAQASVPVQDFVVRNDSGCGSTIGPIISSKTGVRTIDVGSPMWSMHSCRENMATSDATHLLKMCEAFYSTFREIDSATANL